MNVRKTTLIRRYRFISLLLIAGAAALPAFASSNNERNESINIMELKPEGGTPLKLYVLDCGEISANELSIFNPIYPPGTQKTFSDACYLIKHPKGTLIWDAGLPDALSQYPNGFDAAGGAFTAYVHKTMLSQLQEINIDPASVNYIAMSHLHFDHTGNANYFTNATWLIQQPENDVAFTDQGVAYGFDPSSYSELADNPRIILTGHFDVFGDKSVVVISTPGHTPGHQSLYLDLPQTGPIVLSGDLFHFQENRDAYAVPSFNSSIRETVHSFVLMDDFLDKVHATLWIQHDKPTFDSLMHAPNYYQ